MKRRLMAAALAALLLSGCTTAAEQACANGQTLNNMTAEQTCMYGLMQREQINSALAGGAAVLAAGAIGVAAYDATRPSYTYVYPQPVYLIGR
jgi:hypothetical protein